MHKYFDRYQLVNRLIEGGLASTAPDGDLTHGIAVIQTGEDRFAVGAVEDKSGTAPERLARLKELFADAVNVEVADRILRLH